MRLLNLKKVPNYKVQEWLESDFKEMTIYQKEWMRNEEFVKFAPFEFYERRKKVKNVFIRLTLMLYVITWIFLIFGLPFNFLFTGNWGYNKLKWFSKWGSSCGL